MKKHLSWIILGIIFAIPVIILSIKNVSLILFGTILIASIKCFINAYTYKKSSVDGDFNHLIDFMVKTRCSRCGCIMYTFDKKSVDNFYPHFCNNCLREDGEN